MKIKCMVVLGHMCGGTIESIKRCMERHSEWDVDAQYYESEYSAEGFINTLITDQLIDDDLAWSIIEQIANGDTEDFAIGRTDVPKISIDMSDGTGEELVIEFYGYMVGCEADSSDYYSEVSEDDIYEYWDGRTREEVIDSIIAMADSGELIGLFDED